jgi:acetyl esterase/lipase
VKVFGMRAIRVGVAALLLVVATACGVFSKGSAAAAAAPDSSHLNVVYAQGPGGTPLTADVYSPEGTSGPAPTLIIAHGGAFTTGSKESETPYAESMASEGFVVVNVNYTLDKPGAGGYPEVVQEIQHAITWTIANAAKYGGDPDRIGLVGFSAGGYLVAQAGLLESGLPGHPVKAVVTLSAPLALPAVITLLKNRVAACGYATSCPADPTAPSLSAFETLLDFFGCGNGDCSSSLISGASPTSHVAAGDPAFEIFNSSNELMPSSQATDMASQLHAAGDSASVVIVPGSAHGEAYLSQVNGTILTFLQEKLGATPTTPRSVSGSGGQSDTQLVLVILCAVVVVGCLGAMVVAAARRRRPRDRAANQ